MLVEIEKSGNNSHPDPVNSLEKNLKAPILSYILHFSLTPMLQGQSASG